MFYFSYDGSESLFNSVVFKCLSSQGLNCDKLMVVGPEDPYDRL